MATEVITDTLDHPWPNQSGTKVSEGLRKPCTAYCRIKAPTGQEQVITCQQERGRNHGVFHRHVNRYGGTVEWTMR